MNRLELLNDTAAKIKTPIIAVLLGVGIACVLILGCGVPPGKTAKQLSQRPNIILVVTDDTRKSDYSRITSLQEAMSPGLYFHNAFATTSLCCPSRATMLTGMYAHNHGIVQHFDPGTGEDQYHANGYDRRDLPNWLKDSGYDTVLIGKYLNWYKTEEPARPGWTEWFAADTPAENFRLNENGNIRSYPQDAPSAEGFRHWEYVLGDKATAFIKRHSDSDGPWFMWYGTHAPHSPELVAPRHAGVFADEPLLQRPNFDEADVSDKPRWIRDNPPLTDEEKRWLTNKNRRRLGSLLAVADNLERIKTMLRETGQLNNTYIILVSDVSGPGVPEDTRQHITLNTDIAPTIADLADVTPPYVPDGRSFVSLLNSEPPDTDSWRRRFMVEHWQVPTVKGLWPATTNRALRGTGYMYNRYLNGERELYNLYEDPFELTNQYPSMSDARKEQLDGLWEDLVQCKGVECKKAEN